MTYLAGTDTMENLQRHRLVVVYDPKDERASMEQMGLYDTEGLFYVRTTQETRRGGDTIEILFEFQSDLEQVKQHLTQHKMSLD